MKNIFVAIALFFALGASAQVKKTAIKDAPVKELTLREAAEKDFQTLNSIVGVTNESTKANLIKTFETKHSVMSNATLSQERRDAATVFVTSRLEELLGTEGFAKLKANDKVYKKLIK